MGPFPKARDAARPLLIFAALFCFVLAVFYELMLRSIFGAEFPLFWVYGHGQNLQSVIDTYKVLNFGWYRPTPTALAAWIIGKFVAWHDFVGWRIFDLLSLALTASALYWFVLVLAPGARTAALLAALFYLSHPAQYTLPIQMLPLDALYVLFGLLSAGFYWRAIQKNGWTSSKETAISVTLYAVALTCKEMVLALPAFLAVESAIAISRRLTPDSLGRRIAREFGRLAPFACATLAYWWYHVRPIQSTMGANATYRMSVNWEVVVANLRMLPLMTMRIFYLAGYKIQWRSYLETATSNAGGFAILLITLAGWVWLWRRRSELRVAGLLFLAWTIIALLIPIYSGGQIWHVTMPAAGYGALFGFGAAAVFEMLPRVAWRRAALAASVAVLLLLGTTSLHDELQRGLFTQSSTLTQDLLVHPPIPPEKLGLHPIIYMEDRLNLGGWSYGCYGHLMRFIYQRPDIQESIVSPGKLGPQDYATLLHNPEAYYVVYDSRYRWKDITPEMRSALHVVPGYLDLKDTGSVQFTATTPGGEALPVTWSIDPHLGSMDAAGWYTPPAEITSRDEGALAIVPEVASVTPQTGIQFTGGYVNQKTVVAKAVSEADPAQSGSGRINIDVVSPGAVTWSIEPRDGGAITPSGYYSAPAASEPRTVMVRATSAKDTKTIATAMITLGSPWQTLDIGHVFETGEYQRAGEILRVRGSGDIFGKSDAFRFVFQKVDGDGTVVGQVSTAATRDFTKAGLMIRERLDDQAAHVFAGVISGKTSIVEARTKSGESTSVEFGRSDSFWFRVDRRGDLFSVFTSSDGNHWETLGKPVHIRMDRRVYSGIAVSSGNRGSAAATFAHLRATATRDAVIAVN
jgi:regulation of enolase protein 1 (concanavalin A-like superfamily)